MSKYRIWKFSVRKIILFFLISTIFLLNSCRYIPQDDLMSDTGFFYDTVITITVYECNEKDNAMQIINDCMELAADYDRLLSSTIEGSDIWNINHSNGAYISVDAETAELLRYALVYAELSDGMVDPTIGALSSLWNFGSDNQEIIPEEIQIQEALSHVNYRSLQISGNQVILTDPAAQLELGFIAKGYIADKLKAYLLSQGVTSAVINLGGNVVTLGSKPDGMPFRIGIQDPFSKAGSSTLQIESTNSSIVSSGNYERYFEKEGIRYHHILSTQTGFPIDSGLSQVTIIHEDSTLCDAFSTLCYLLGYEKSALMLENYPDVRAVFITEDGKVLYANF